MNVSQAVLQYIRADTLMEALLPKLHEVSPENLSALKLRLSDWNRKRRKWKAQIEGEKSLAEAERIAARILAQHAAPIVTITPLAEKPGPPLSAYDYHHTFDEKAK